MTERYTKTTSGTANLAPVCCSRIVAPHPVPFLLEAAMTAPEGDVPAQHRARYLLYDPAIVVGSPKPASVAAIASRGASCTVMGLPTIAGSAAAASARADLGS